MQARHFILLFLLSIVSAHMHHPSPMPGQTTDISSPTQGSQPPPRGRPNHGPVPGRHRPSPRPGQPQTTKTGGAVGGKPSPLFMRRDQEVLGEYLHAEESEYGLRRLDLEESGCSAPGERKCLVPGMGSGLGSNTYECIDVSSLRSPLYSWLTSIADAKHFRQLRCLHK